MHFSKITDIFGYHNFSRASESLNMLEVSALRMSNLIENASFLNSELLGFNEIKKAKP
jgi:hypothetical protein